MTNLASIKFGRYGEFLMWQSELGAHIGEFLIWRSLLISPNPQIKNFAKVPSIQYILILLAIT